VAAEAMVMENVDVTDQGSGVGRRSVGVWALPIEGLLGNNVRGHDQDVIAAPGAVFREGPSGSLTCWGT